METTPTRYPPATRSNRLPTLRRHVTGVYFAQWKGRYRYFTLDRAESERLYAGLLGDIATTGTGTTRVTVRQAAAMWLADCEARRLRPRSVRSYRLHLKRTLDRFGDWPASRFGTEQLRALVADWSASGAAPKTIAHWKHAASMALAYAGVTVGRVRGPKLTPPRPRVLTPQQVRSVIERAAVEWTRRGRWDVGHDLAHWLALQYLTVTRPSEVLRLVAGQYDDLGGGRGRLWTSKTGAPRFVLLTDEARGHLRAAHFRWHDQTGYRLACYRAFGPSGLPHVLRHSAASHLHSLGVGLDRVSIILGHRVRGALGHYLEPDWAGMLEEVGRLTVADPCTPPPP